MGSTDEPASVGSAVARIARRDARLGGHARIAAEWLTAGEGPETLCQAALQQFLWWDLPRKFELPRWDDLVSGTAALLDELGLPGYSAIARSRQTQDILGAWRFQPDDATKRYREAAAASGVDPPDTDRFAWGSVMGIYELDARQAVERALETAIVAKEVVPGRSGWKQAAARVCNATLTAPLDGAGDQTLLSSVVNERATSWVAGARSDVHRAWSDQMVERVLSPIPVPAEAAGVVAPMRWLLERCATGLPLTQSGYIARLRVVEAAERFSWWDWDKAPRSEADVPQLGELREAATALHLIRRSGHQLLSTAKGRSLADDPGRLWAEVAGTLGGMDGFGKMVAELVGLKLLLDGPAIDDGLEESLFPIVSAQGWRVGPGPVEGIHLSHVIHERLYWWRILHLLDEHRSRWDNGQRIGPNTTALTQPGEATVVAYLQRRATGPRTSPLG